MQFIFIHLNEIINCPWKMLKLRCRLESKIGSKNYEFHLPAFFPCNISRYVIRLIEFAIKELLFPVCRVKIELKYIAYADNRNELCIIYSGKSGRTNGEKI